MLQAMVHNDSQLRSWTMLVLNETDVRAFENAQEQEELCLEDLEEVAGGGCGITININLNF